MTEDFTEDNNWVFGRNEDIKEIDAEDQSEEKRKTDGRIKYFIDCIMDQESSYLGLFCENPF